MKRYSFGAKLFLATYLVAFITITSATLYLAYLWW